jgi:hypothetical protein
MIRHWSFGLIVALLGLVIGIVVAVNGPRHGLHNWPLIFRIRAVGIGLFSGIVVTLIPALRRRNRASDGRSSS